MVPRHQAVSARPDAVPDKVRKYIYYVKTSGSTARCTSGRVPVPQGHSVFTLEHVAWPCRPGREGGGAARKAEKRKRERPNAARVHTAHNVTAQLHGCTPESNAHDTNKGNR